jgi:hypothetical protein
MWVVLAACGRIGFDPGDAGSAGSGDAASDGASDAVPAGTIAWRKSFGANGTNQTTTVSGQAMAANDLIIFHVACGSAGTATGVTVTAPGWTFTQLSAPFGYAGQWAATFFAFAPDTASTTITATWMGLTCSTGNNMMGDEFANATVDSHAESNASGDCLVSIGSFHANDAVWAACTSNTTLTAVEAGYTKGGDDSLGDWSEYKLTSDPANTVYTVTFMGQSGQANAMTAATLQPR